MNKIRLLIVDDSVVIKRMFMTMLEGNNDIEVIGTAADPFEAREKIKLLNPDIITLDIEMPKMNGLEFLEKIMSLRPMPVIMVSTLTEKGAYETIKALELGAIDCIAKPKINDVASLHEIKEKIIRTIKEASLAKIKPIVVRKQSIISSRKNNYKIDLVAIGASTGGVEAIKEVVCGLPNNFPPILVVQHMPPGYTASLAYRLNTLSQMEVCEARHSQDVVAGNIYIAPGDMQMTVKKNGHKISINLDKNAELISGHKPSVDALFTSVSQNMPKHVMGVILTGMGKDGANGMELMKQRGSFNIGQNEETCVVYGMPKAAKLNNAIDIELPLHKIAESLVKYAENGF